MSETGSDELISGRMFLYQKPELLTQEEHGALGLTPNDHPFAHVAGARAIPITLAEFGSAQRHYPIIFSALENPMPLAIVGLTEDSNLFVDANGQWDPLCYIPAYLRCYPFTLAAEKSGRLAAVVDRAAPIVTENPQFPFFEDGKISEHTENMMRFCAQYDAEKKRTKALCERLVELGLLTAQRATHRPEGSEQDVELASYVSVDGAKLTELAHDEVIAFHKSGQLSALYVHLYSLENWRHLMARRALRPTL